MGDLTPRVDRWEVDANTDGVTYLTVEGLRSHIPLSGISYILFNSYYSWRDNETSYTVYVATKNDGRFAVAGSNNNVDKQLIELVRTIGTATGKPGYINGFLQDGCIIDKKGDYIFPKLSTHTEKQNQYSSMHHNDDIIISGFSKEGGFSVWPIAFFPIAIFIGSYLIKHLSLMVSLSHTGISAIITFAAMLYFIFLDKTVKYQCEWQLQIAPEMWRMSRYNWNDAKVDLVEIAASERINILRESQNCLMVTGDSESQAMIIDKLPAKGIDELGKLLKSCL